MVTGVCFAKGLPEEIRALAAASPEEVCGLLFGTPDRVDAMLVCRNVATDPLTAFEIDPAQLLAAHRSARGAGPRIVGCYHSHPGGDAAPSPRDALSAAANGWLWVIVGGEEARVFRVVEGGAIHGRFEEVPLIS